MSGSGREAVSLRGTTQDVAAGRNLTERGAAEGPLLAATPESGPEGSRAAWKQGNVDNEGSRAMATWFSEDGLEPHLTSLSQL